MPDNIGEMFYFGEVPWHKKGTKIEKPATAEEAIKAGGLDWKVDFAPLQTAEDPPSPVTKRHAIVRTDRPLGHPGRVVGVTHKQFRPLQNRQGVALFDAIFGKGQPVYHTGGYLGSGEIVWLLADLNRPVLVTPEDKVWTYALFANSHDGSIAMNVQLTMVRVVCQNTLTLALQQGAAPTVFRRAHDGNYGALQADLEDFFKSTLRAVETEEQRLQALVQMSFSKSAFDDYVTEIIPPPPPPRTKTVQARRLFEARVERADEVRSGITLTWDCSETVAPVKHTAWGALNAVTEYVDHQMPVNGDRYTVSLFGSAADLKRNAYATLLSRLN